MYFDFGVQHARDNRDKAIETVEEGRVSADHLLLCCLKWMSNDEVVGMLAASVLSDSFLEAYDVV